MQPDGHNRPDLLEPIRVQSLWDFSSDPLFDPANPTPSKIPSMAPSLRSAARNKPPSASGSDYHESSNSMDVDDQPQSKDPPTEYHTSRGRKVTKKSYQEPPSTDDDRATEDGPPDELDVIDQPVDQPSTDQQNGALDDEDEDQGPGHYGLRPRSRPTQIVDSDDEAPRYQTRKQSKRLPPTEDLNGSSGGRLTRRSANRTRSRRTKPRTVKVNAREQHDDEGYIDQSSSGSADAEGSLDDGVRTSSDIDDPPAEDPQDGRTYSLRARAKINYAIPPPLDEMPAPQLPKPVARMNGRNGLGSRKINKPPGWSATGAELSRWMGGGPVDDSDSDYGPRSSRRPFGVGAGGAGGSVFAGGAGSNGMLPADLAAAAGTPSNLGKVGDVSLADTDPLGVNQNVTFDEVGGLDDHINSLKEMTLLPLLYPEVFQQFGLTPPRGVLFHGPPGTGKTLLARALAASCRSNGRGISFFMRKGADCLSKWVGEAERQLRLLFEEARNQQPSIIFFDEIDGLAPVRSSKQDQIHASIVSTLLALMDGMDGRGQVIVIGATNRPDAIDPALRRPGRFDREFYFPLPNLPARERILSIMTRKWAGWTETEGEEKVKGLAELTKGYGGADLRALCTEAALNAIQRRYPQIYKSSDRLLLNPESIKVQLRDFMIAIRKMVPSSARATAPPTTPLPSQLVPLLGDAVEKAKEAISRVISTAKKRTALEEAEWEEDSEEGALKREMALQLMEALRVYRPRVVLHGGIGMGQRYVAEAALHSLDGFHIHGLDLGHLLSDSARTPEAALVQLFTEAKRHKPSVIYIPSLLGWCSTLTETTRSTMFAMLDGLAPTEPILLLAYVDGPFSSLPADVKSWFGTRHNRVEVTNPPPSLRERFFADLLQNIRMPPNHFPDSVGRKKRVLEELPLAPPLEPRTLTAAELEVQAEADLKVVTQLKYHLGTILTELKRKFKRFTKSTVDEYGLDPSAFLPPLPPQPAPPPEAPIPETGEAGDQEATQPVDIVNGISEEGIQQQVQIQPQFFDMDLERMHIDLYKSKYLTPQDFLDDIRKIVHNASIALDQDSDRLFRAQALYTAAELSTQNFDAQFRLDCERMAIRERKRREEYRKSRGKGRTVEADKPASSSEVYPPGTRRSARHNGQEPEIAITDPVQLERRLKRQRSAELATESMDDADEGSRDAKRTRIVADEAAAEVVVVQIPARDSPPRPHTVRFAVEVEVEQVPPIALPEVPAPSEEPPVEVRPRTAFEGLLNPEPVEAVLQPLTNGVVVPLETTPQPHTLRPQSPPELQVVPADSVDPVVAETITQEVAQELVAVEEPQAMEVCDPQKEDTPIPLPDLVVDEELVSQLSSMLCEFTHPLNIEQLEELRATCLNVVWHHRAAWDRTPLIQKLCDLVKDFVGELGDSPMHASSP